MAVENARNYHKKVIGDPQDINFMEKWLAGLSEELQSGLLEALSKQNINLNMVLSGNTVIELIENYYPSRQQIYQIDGKPLLKIKHSENSIQVQVL